MLLGIMENENKKAKLTCRCLTVLSSPEIGAQTHEAGLPDILACSSIDTRLGIARLDSWWENNNTVFQKVQMYADEFLSSSVAKFDTLQDHYVCLYWRYTGIWWWTATKLLN